MSELEIRARLQRALHTQITWAEWKYLKRIGYINELLNGELDWQEFRSLASEGLDWIRRFYEDKLLEQDGMVEKEIELGPELDLTLAAGQPDASDKLSKRTVARAWALSALNRLHAGDRFTPGPIIHGTHKPRGGVDGTVPQWVIFLGVEAWVPAEEVKEAYRAHQRALLAEQAPPKTQERAFEVARFVWEEERLHGERSSWPVLWERWNNWPLTKPFNKWRDFRTYYLRGERATTAQYFASNEQMTEAVRSRAFEHSFDRWVSSFRE